MDLKKLFTEERAVSPVIGVILMVAITVILAAVIGAFVLGIGGDQNATPTASISLDLDGDATDEEAAIEISHNGGQTLDLDDVGLSINGTFEDDPFSNGGDTFSSGETITINENELGEDWDDGAEVRIVHEPSGGLLASGTA